MGKMTDRLTVRIGSECGSVTGSCGHPNEACVLIESWGISSITERLLGLSLNLVT
jgi:hypothetical protein